MKSRFPGYIRPTDEELRRMWQEGVFAFDANMLLHIYRYTPETQESFLLVLERLKDRIWTPYQAATEYYENRGKVIEDQLKVYDDIHRLLDEAYIKLQNQLAAYKRHVSVQTEHVLEAIKSGVAEAKEALDNNKQNHPDIASSDRLGDRITALFDGRVGPQFSSAKLLEIYEEAERRFKIQQPPGFKDAKGKDYPDKYSDVVMWFQLIEHGKTQRQPIIFVTDDRKEDWWQKDKGQTVAPRPELINEIENEAHIKFYMYHSEQFLKYAQEFLALEDQQAAIQEVEEIGQQDEAYQGAIDYFESHYSISRRALENQTFDDRLFREAVEAARSFNNPLIRQAIETAKSLAFDSPAVRQAVEAVRSIDTSLVRQAIENAKAFDNPLIRQAVERARAADNPLMRQAIEAAKSFDNPLIRRAVEEARTFDSSLMQQAVEAAKAWRNNPLSGQPMPQHISVDISPKRSSELPNNAGSNDVKVEVLLNSELYSATEDDQEDGTETLEPRAKTPPYEFNNYPVTITLTHYPHTSHSHNTLHRLRNPSAAEWAEWGLNIESTRRYLSPIEIDEFNVGKDEDEEKATEVWETFYGEWEASKQLYNQIILEIAGIQLGEHDDFPTDQFRKFAPELIDRLPFEFKETVITGLYKCWCGVARPASIDETTQQIYQNLSYQSSSYDVLHTLRKPTEDESYAFRTNIVKGHFSTNTDDQEIIQMKLDLSTATTFYDELIINIENATVDSQSFSGNTRDAFLTAINPVHKLRVLEPLFDVNAWYFKIDDWKFP